MIFFAIRAAIINLVAFIEILIMLSETLRQVLVLDSADLQSRVRCDTTEMVVILIAYNFGEQDQFTCSALQYL